MWPKLQLSHHWQRVSMDLLSETPEIFGTCLRMQRSATSLFQKYSANVFKGWSTLICFINWSPKCGERWEAAVTAAPCLYTFRRWKLRSTRGPQLMVGEAWSWKGTFCPDRGPADLSGLHLASARFFKNYCPDIHIWPIFCQKISRIWGKINACILKKWFSSGY